MKIKYLFFALFLSSKTFADEGMWLPMLLGQQIYDDMVKKGLKLTKDQLYSINKPSVKDAILIFGGGCTGEIVSTIESSTSAPPMVGVPALARCVCGPSSRTAWPIL